MIKLIVLYKCILVFFIAIGCSNAENSKVKIVTEKEFFDALRMKNSTFHYFKYKGIKNGFHLIYIYNVGKNGSYPRLHFIYKLNSNDEITRRINEFILNSK